MSPFLTPSRRALALGLLVALVAAGAVALAVGGCGGNSPTTAQVPTRGQSLETIFEAQTELLTDPSATLDLLKRLGVTRVKVFVPWASLAPDALSRTRPQFDASSPASYPAASWSIYDAIVRAAAARGVGLDVALEAPAPLWATGPGVPHGTAAGFLGAWKPSPQEFGLFVAAVAKRYSGHYKPSGAGSALPRLDFWSIWNEPNYGQQLAPQAIDQSTVEVSPMLYRGLLDAAWNALEQTGHAHDRVLIGEVAPRGQTLGDQPGNFSGMVPLRFIRALYCVDGALRPLRGEAAALRGCPTSAAASAAFPREHPALFGAGGFAFHPYPQGFAPNVRTPGFPDYADLPQVPSLEQTLDRALAAYGSSTRFPLYDTEFGYQTNPPEATIARAVKPSQAAAWANLAEYMSWLDPRIVSWDQYLLADPPPGASSFDTGLQFYGGKPKALYAAFRLPLYLPATAGPSGHALVVWGCVRPAHYVMLHSGGPQVADIQLKPAAGGTFETVKRVTVTDAYGYFDVPVTFPSSGLVRVEWAYPHGPRIHSRTVPITIR
ncbi:MAG: hypothetical protein JO046_17875 [Solirubrobacterales bacterium]|nr:hypothetical protein [Solirubrobacterales bacterium]MBV9683664.1 hypothetical protein [Solirubrobacterales bacterium]